MAIKQFYIQLLLFKFFKVFFEFLTFLSKYAIYC